MSTVGGVNLNKVIEIGDWIRFQRGGSLVIGSVVYLEPRARWDSTLRPVTAEYGPIDAEYVLEVRPPLPPVGRGPQETDPTE